MPLTGASRRDSAEAAEAERLRPVRDQLEAAVSGLAELEYLRQRQEELVRTALRPRAAAAEEEEQEEEEAPLSSEEMLLEENILLLRKQLTCLRRRDAGLISQLQELDRQISDLRLDTEESHDQSDSRPSSGFYELSEAASGSLSNSSNSVFSECLTDERPGCLDCDGLWDDWSGTLHRSLSAPRPPDVDPVPSVASSDSQSQHHCDLTVWNGSDVYRYPSPLHAVTVKSPALLQTLGHAGLGRDEGRLTALGSSSHPGSVSALLVPQSSSWPVSSSSSSSNNPFQKHLDSYIYSLLQGKVLPVRTSRPRTGISTDPSKSLLRQVSLCRGQLSLKGSELTPTWSAGWSPPRQRPVVEQETQHGVHGNLKVNSSNFAVKDTSTGGLLKKTSRGLRPSSLAGTQDLKELGRPDANVATETKQPCCPPDQSDTPTNNPRPLRADRAERGDGSVLELTSVGTSSQSPDRARGGGGRSHKVSTRSVPSQQQNLKLCKGNRTNPKTTTAATRTSERDELTERKGVQAQRRCHCKKSLLLEDGDSAHIKVSKRSPGRAAGTPRSRPRRLSPSIPESRVLEGPSAGWCCKTSHCHHYGHTHHRHLHHHQPHGRDHLLVAAKPKHKRNDYRRLRAIVDVPRDEALRRAQRRCRKKELLSDSAAVKLLPSEGPPRSPGSRTGGSDSEYSAECVSLFHSTVVDTSEDERSDYTTNCFGDSESSEEDDEDESSGKAGEGGGRGTGSGWNQSVGHVKIKASHNLKKKILRFRPGSLKLMTTV